MWAHKSTINQLFLLYIATQTAVMGLYIWITATLESPLSILQSITLGMGLLIGSGSICWWKSRSITKQSSQGGDPSEGVLQNIIDNSPTLMYAVNKQGQYLLINKEFKHWINDSSGNMLDKAHRDYFTPEISDLLAQQDDEVMRSGNTQETEQSFYQDGCEYTFLSTRFRLTDRFGTPYAVCCIATDISQRKATEKRLLESELNFRALTENANDGIFVNLNGKHVFANKRVIEMLEYDSIEDFLGTGIKDVVHPKLYDEIAARANSRLSSHKQPDHYETTFITKDGKDVPIEMTVAVTSWQGQTAGFAILRDIRERKKIEEEIRRHKDQLEELICIRTDKLTEAIKELEAFSYSVSHDLRAPLRSIDGFSQILIEDYHSLLDETGNNYLQRIRFGAQRMSQLIDDILSLSRLSNQNLHIREVNLSGMAESVIAEIKRNHPNQPVNCIIAPNIKAQGDPRLLRIVLENLIDNAWKYSSKSKLTYIEFGSRTVDNEIQYYIRDKGVGFEMQYVDKLFTAFQRLHNTEDYPGSGIGLASVARIVHRHGGKVWAESQSNQGSTFFFTTNPQQ